MYTVSVYWKKTHVNLGTFLKRVKIFPWHTHCGVLFTRNGGFVRDQPFLPFFYYNFRSGRHLYHGKLYLNRAVHSDLKYIYGQIQFKSDFQSGEDYFLTIYVVQIQIWCDSNFLQSRFNPVQIRFDQIYISRFSTGPVRILLNRDDTRIIF